MKENLSYKKYFVCFSPILGAFMLVTSSYAQIPGSTLSVDTNMQGSQAQEQGSVINEVLDQIERKYEPDQNLQENPLVTLEILDETLDVLEVRDMGIKDVFKLISLKSGLAISVAENVVGTVTLFLKDISIRDALKIIVDTNSLAYTHENNSLQIMTAQAFKNEFGYSFSEDLRSKVVSLKYAQATDVWTVLNPMKSDAGKVFTNSDNNSLILIDRAEQLESMLAFIGEFDVPTTTEAFVLKHVAVKSLAKEIQKILTHPIGRLQMDEGLNQIVVTDTLSKLKKVRGFIEQSDSDQRDIGVDSKVIQIMLNDEHLQGVDWEAIVSNFQKIKDLSLGTVSKDDYQVLLEALDTVGAVSTISDQRIVVAEGRENEFDVELSALDVQEINEHNLIVHEADKTFEFMLTPAVQPDDVLSLTVRPKNLENKRTAQIEKKHTVVIGGMFDEVTVASTKKIPFLGDLPLLGFAFRNEGQTTRKTEIIVFLTPEVL